jgi:hypothetical protein
MDDLLSLPLLRPLWEKLAHLPPLLRQWGDTPLGDIAARFTHGAQDDAPVSNGLLTEVRAMIEPILGPAVATNLASRLTVCPSVLSANYHGVECFPEMVQAIHFFALHDFLADAGETETRIVPVLSCSSVSLQSQTYPRGLMLSRRHEGRPVRLPFFPSSLQDTMAGHAPALAQDSLRKMRGQWFRKDKNFLLDWERTALDAIMDGHVMRPEVLTLPTFGGQITRVNASLCAERYNQAPRTEVVYLDMETLVARLLTRDIENETSVMRRILFDPRTRNLVLDKLAGIRGCWRTEALNGLALGRTGRAGTVFFWMADEKGRRCPLRLCTSPSGETGLGYGRVCIPLRPRPVLDALAAGTIVPSLFTAYMNLTLDHGLRCFGGIFLADYLPAMIRGVSAAMDEAGTPLNALPQDLRLAALPLTVQIDSGQGLLPAGAVELAAAGGLTGTQLADISRLALADVLPLSLASWYQDYVRPEDRPPGWERAVTELASRWSGIVIRPARP